MVEIITAISLHQPWAELIALKIKTHETRHWRYPARLEGQRILIHAAKRVMKPKEVHPALLARLDAPRLAYGAYVLTARLAGCFRTEERIPSSPLDELAGGWEPGRFAWALEDIRRLPAPIPDKGRQSLWTVQSAILGDHADEP